MPRFAEQNLALAVERPGLAEDTLTEVLAGVLDLDQALARRLLSAVESVADHAPVAIITQSWHPAIGKIDMWLDGGTSRCWVENKLWARFGENQLERYSGTKARGLVIVPESRRSEVPADPRWVSRTWDDVIELARELLEEEGVTIEDARRPGALACHKARSDLIGYLEAKNVTTTRAPGLTTSDVEALATVQYTLGTAIPGMLRAIKEKAVEAGFLGVGIDEPPADRSLFDWGWVTSDPPEGTWVSALGGWFDANIAGRPDFADVPAFAVGCMFPRAVANAAQVRFLTPEWETVLTLADFQVIPVDRAWRAVRVFPLPLEGDTLEAQASRAATDFVRAVEDLLRLQTSWDALPTQMSEDEQ